MRINTNISSLMAQNQLSRVSAEADTAMQRLTSGKRINTAADDAAGLQIVSKMTSEINGSRQASRNTNDAISFIQTADGAMDSIGNMLQRSRELLVQKANGTNSTFDRNMIRLELEEIEAGIQDIVDQTSFNGIRVFGDEKALKGNDSIEYALQTYWLPESEYLIEEFFGLTGKGNSINLRYAGDGPGDALASVGWNAYNAAEGGSTYFELNIDPDDIKGGGLASGNFVGNLASVDRVIAHEMVHGTMAANMDMSTLPGWFTEGAAELMAGADHRVASSLAAAGSSAALMGTLHTAVGSPTTSAGYSTGYVATRMLHEAADDKTGGPGIKGILQALARGDSFDDAIRNNTDFASQAAFQTHVTGGAGAAYVDGMNLTDEDTGSIHGSVYGFEEKSDKDTLSNFAAAPTEKRFKLKGAANISEKLATGIQVGFQEGDQISINRVFVDTGAIGIRGIDYKNVDHALEQVDHAIKTVTEKRSYLGAMQNRMEFALSSLANQQENMSAARSRIEDADFAQESAQLSRAQVLSQASQAMLAQANSAPKQILQLIQG